MKNKNGQALVEFIIIMPVLIYVILIMIDILVIYNQKTSLESRMDGAVYLYKENRESEIKAYLNKDLKNVTYKIEKDNDYTYLKVNMEHIFMTPGISNILGKNYNIKTERVIINGKSEE